MECINSKDYETERTKFDQSLSFFWLSFGMDKSYSQFLLFSIHQGVNKKKWKFIDNHTSFINLFFD